MTINSILPNGSHNHTYYQPRPLRTLDEALARAIPAALLYGHGYWITEVDGTFDLHSKEPEPGINVVACVTAHGNVVTR